VTTPVRLVVAAGGAAWEAQAIAIIEDRSDLRLVRRCVDVADLLAVGATESAEVAIVSPSLPGLDVDVVDRVRRAGVRLLAMAEGDPRSVQRLDLDEPLTLDTLPHWSVAEVDDALPEQRRQGSLIAVWGPTGAPGRSAVALSIASALAARGTGTILVDADVEGGAQAQAVGLLDDISGLVAATRAANQGLAHEAVRHAQIIEPHLRLVTGLPRADMADQVRPVVYEQVVSALLDDADAVVVDCGFSVDAERGGRGGVTVATLQRADQIVVVGRSDPLGLARLVRALHDLATVAPGRAPRVLLNHARRGLGWNQREVDSTISRLTGVVPEAHLPWDQNAWDTAALAGRTPRDAAPSSPFVARVEAFAATLLTPSQQVS